MKPCKLKGRPGHHRLNRLELIKLSKACVSSDRQFVSDLRRELLDDFLCVWSHWKFHLRNPWLLDLDLELEIEIRAARRDAVLAAVSRLREYRFVCSRFAVLLN